MSTSFPYKKGFFASLQKKHINDSTLLQYEHTLSDFFNYEQHFNEIFAKDQLLSNLAENDVKTYLEMLSHNRQYQDTTLNKTLSNLKVYFNFLFEHRIITTPPTFSIKSKALVGNRQVTDWPTQLPEWLINKDIHPYTRVYLLLISKGFQLTEILSPGFYKIFNQLDFNASEQVAVDDLKAYNLPLQQSYDCKELFLKHTARGTGYTLSLPALHRYLRADSERLGIPIKPALLRKEYMIWYLAKHRNQSTGETMKQLRLDINSLEYYQNQLRIKDIQQLRAK